MELEAKPLLEASVLVVVNDGHLLVGGSATVSCDGHLDHDTASDQFASAAGQPSFHTRVNLLVHVVHYCELFFTDSIDCQVQPSKCEEFGEVAHCSVNQKSLREYLPSMIGSSAGPSTTRS